MKSKRLRALLVALLVVAIAGLLLAYWVNARGAHALAAYRKQLIAAGEKLTVDELLPPAVPPAENGVSALRQANMSWHTGGGLLGTNYPPAMKMVAPGKAMVGWAQLFVHSEAASNRWDDVQALIQLSEPGFESLQQIVRHPSLDFQLDYRASFSSVTFSHLIEMKSAVQMSSAATISDLHRGDPASAGARIRIILALVKADQEERMPISQLVRMSMAHIGIAATWEWLQFTNLNEQQLVALQRDWAEQEFLRPAELSLSMERVISQETFESMRKSSAAFRQEVIGRPTGASSGPWYEQLSSTALLKTKESLWRVALSYPDQLRGMKAQQVLIDAVRRAARDRCFAPAFQQQEKQWADLGMRVHKDDTEGWLTKVGDTDIASLSDGWVQPLGRFLNRVYYTEAARRLVITAIALKRYQQRHGALPASLAELVPEFLHDNPRDPINGQPLRYRLKEDSSFLLYSIGDDCHDDGGDPSPPNGVGYTWLRGRDLVWPQPATPEEVRVHFEKKQPR